MAQGSKGLGFMHLTCPVMTFPNEFNPDPWEDLKIRSPI